MALTIMTNTLAVGAQRTLGNTDRRLSSALERLSSGTRIVKAADDPAGLAISDSLISQSRSMGQAIRNAQDGVSLIQVFEGGTTEINNMLMRIRELSMQAASDTVGDEERMMVNAEVEQLRSEITRVARTTIYAGSELLSGKTIKMDFQVGIHNNPDVDRIEFNPGDTNLTADALGVGDVNVTTKENAQSALDHLDAAIVRVNSVRARVGSAQNRLTAVVNAQGLYQENIMAANSRIRDADMAQESANLAKESILRQAGIAVLTQANEAPRVVLQLLRNF